MRTNGCSTPDLDLLQLVTIRVLEKSFPLTKAVSWSVLHASNPVEHRSAHRCFRISRALIPGKHATHCHKTLRRSEHQGPRSYSPHLSTDTPRTRSLPHDCRKDSCGEALQAPNLGVDLVKLASIGIGLGVLALVLVLVVAVLAGKDSLTVLVKLQAGDNNVGRVDAHVDGGSVGALPGDALDVDHELLTVHAGDLAIAVLERAADNRDVVILADGHGAHVVLAAELAGERRRHNDAALVRGSREVSAAALAAGRGDGGLELHALEDDGIVWFKKGGYVCSQALVLVRRRCLLGGVRMQSWARSAARWLAGWTAGWLAVCACVRVRRGARFAEN